MNDITFAITRTAPLGDVDLSSLIDDCVADGHNMVRRLVREWREGINRFDQPDETLWTAIRDGRPIGVCGLNADPFAATPRTGRVRRLYVHRAHRRCGIGRALVQTVIDATPPHFDRLHVRTFEPAAVYLYESLGFVPVTNIERCTHVLCLKESSGCHT